MKKKIAIILFNKHLNENSYTILIPRLALSVKTTNILNLSLGIKYIFLNNKTLFLKTTNLFYFSLPNKLELKKILISYRTTFFGFKFKNLYFSSLTIKQYSYITNFFSTQFLTALKKMYFFISSFIFAFQKKIKLLK